MKKYNKERYRKYSLSLIVRIVCRVSTNTNYCLSCKKNEISDFCKGSLCTVNKVTVFMIVTIIN